MQYKMPKLLKRRLSRVFTEKVKLAVIGLAAASVQVALFPSSKGSPPLPTTRINAVLGLWPAFVAIGLGAALLFYSIKDEF